MSICKETTVWIFYIKMLANKLSLCVCVGGEIAPDHLRSS